MRAHTLACGAPVNAIMLTLTQLARNAVLHGVQETLKLRWMAGVEVRRRI